MPSEIRLIDTNILLRFFTGEPAGLAEKARAVIAEADRGALVLEIHPLVIAETIFTLESYYKMPKERVCDRLSAFLRSRGISPCDEDVMFDALERYRTHNIHFVDACLAAYGAASTKAIHSFDRDFGRFDDVKWTS